MLSAEGAEIDMGRWLSWMRWSGRLRRRTFLWQMLVAVLAFTVAYVFIERIAARGATLLAYPFFFAAALSLCVRRLHDQARSAWWLLAAIVPILGPLLLGLLLVFKRGTPGDNQYGEDPRLRGRDYLQVAIHDAH
jgi:uncharacterized membrane protein YhaH (DUF805 family)